MKNEIFVNVGPRETRVAVRETDRVVELHIERAAERGVVGGIYKGRVTRVLPGMQAAFVDIGLERGGFLYVADYRADFDDDDDDESPAPAPSRRRGAAQRGQGPQIEDLLEEGREILVQVKKEPLGTKGARIESRISLAGRHLVLMPGASRVGVSRRIAGDRERRRLRKIVDSLRPADQELGFIVRTVSHGVSEADIKADIDYLVSRWEQVQKRTAETTEVPALIYEEPPLHIRILRDLVTHETKQIVVDDAAAYGEMQEFVKKFMASPRPRIVHYKGEGSLFDAERIEPQIDEGVSRKVWLKSGGHLVIDQAEALTAIDVNTGGFVGGKSRNLEETILKTNLEAVREIARQVRFRNIGGLLILDLIDMEVAANREKVYRALVDAMREDKAKVNLLKISELGLIEMTRKRTRENLTQQLCDPCPICEGKGYLRSPKTLCHKIFRELPKAARCLMGETLVLKVHPDVAELLEGSERDTLERAATAIERTVEVRRDASCHPEQFEISATGVRLVPRPPKPAAEPPAEIEPDTSEAADLADGATGAAEGEPEAKDGPALEAPVPPAPAQALLSALAVDATRDAPGSDGGAAAETAAAQPAAGADPEAAAEWNAAAEDRREP
jgi:ribonuclease G